MEEVIKVEESRKLATIRQVAELVAIEGADNIEVAKIDGWQCVVKKGEFKVGDLAVFFEIDSFLPIQPRFEFLRKGCFSHNFDKTEGFRIKTIRLKKQLAQGLLLPLSEFPEIQLQSIHPDENIGMNLTQLLGVVKWERPMPACLQGKIKGYFPNFLQKTDQERIQNLPEVVMKFWDTEFEITQKLDGSSLTAYLRNGVFGVCSRNLDLEETPENSFWQVARKNKLEEVLRFIGKNIAFQGEMVGPGIQDNYEGLTETEFYLFDIYDIDQRRYLTSKERMEVLSVANGSLGADLKLVPGAPDYKFTLRKFIEACGVSSDAIDTFVNAKVLEVTKAETLTPEDYEKIKHYILRSERVRLLLESANGQSVLNDKIKREGLVFKSSELIDEGKVLSFKAISNAYLERGK